MEGEYYILAIIVVAYLGYHFFIDVPPVAVPDIANESLEEVSTPAIIVVNESTAVQEPFDMFLYRTQGRYLNETFGWQRENVSGLKDMEVYTVVYDYAVLHGYEWWSDSWGRYFYQIPDPSKKFLFIFVNTWMEGNDPSKDPRMWGPDQNHYYLQVNETVISHDTSYVPTIRIKEFEEKYDYRHVVGVGPYGFLNVQDGGSGKRTAVNLSWLRMGTSNNWDGFIVYQIPIDANPEDIKVLGDMYAFGHPYWLLKERPAE